MVNLDFLLMNSNTDGDALVDLDVSTLVGDEYVPLVDDTMRMLTLQIIIQFMLMLMTKTTYYQQKTIVLLVTHNNLL